MEPKIQIVDDNDRIIAHKSRDEINYEVDIYRVAALWLTNSKGQILIAQRHPDKDKDPGRWGPAVAGTVDEGETYEVNIYKEVEEEIGLKGAKLRLGPKMRINTPRKYFCQWYMAQIDKELSEFILQKEEVSQIAWIDQDKLIREVEEMPEKYIPIMTLIMGTLMKRTKNDSAAS